MCFIDVDIFPDTKPVPANNVMAKGSDPGSFERDCWYRYRLVLEKCQDEKVYPPVHFPG
jgi:hypothetical protein